MCVTLPFNSPHMTTYDWSHRCDQGTLGWFWTLDRSGKLQRIQSICFTRIFNMIFLWDNSIEKIRNKPPACFHILWFCVMLPFTTSLIWFYMQCLFQGDAFWSLFWFQWIRITIDITNYFFLRLNAGSIPMDMLVMSPHQKWPSHLYFDPSARFLGHATAIPIPDLSLFLILIYTLFIFSHPPCVNLGFSLMSTNVYLKSIFISCFTVLLQQKAEYQIFLFVTGKKPNTHWFWPTACSIGLYDIFSQSEFGC